MTTTSYVAQHTSVSIETARILNGRVIDKRTSTITTNDILDNVRITWGRNALHSPPSERDATLTIRLSSRYKPEEWKLWLRGKCIIKFKDRAIYQGIIDKIRFRQDDNGVFLDCETVEAKTYPAPMPKNGVTSYRGNDPEKFQGYVQSWLAANGYPYPFEFPDTYWKGRQYTVKPEWHQGLVKRMAESSVAGYPGAWPIWDADFRSVRASNWATRLGIGDLLTIPTQCVTSEPPTVDMEAHPMIVRYRSTDIDSSGRPYDRPLFSTQEPDSTTQQQPSMGSFIPAGYNIKEVINPLPVTWNRTIGVQGLTQEFLQAQITDPRIFTLHDDLLAKTSTPIETFDPLWWTWESRQNFKLTPSTGAKADPFTRDVLRIKDPQYAAIGGTLDIAHDRTSHQLSCIYAETPEPI